MVDRLSWAEVMHMLNAGHVIDYAGDLFVAMAALHMGITYSGMY